MKTSASVSSMSCARCGQYNRPSSTARSEPRSRMPHGEELRERGDVFIVAATVAVPRSATTGNRGPTRQVTYVPPRRPKPLRGTAFRQGRRRPGTHPCASFEQTCGRRLDCSTTSYVHYVPRTISKEKLFSFPLAPMLMHRLALPGPTTPRRCHAPSRRTVVYQSGWTCACSAFRPR